MSPNLITTRQFDRKNNPSMTIHTLMYIPVSLYLVSHTEGLRVFVDGYNPIIL